MANAMRVAKAAQANEEAGGVALAERPTPPNSLWLSALPTLRHAPVGDLLPKLLGQRDVQRFAEPTPIPAVAIVGTIPAAHGPISDLAISSDGRSLVVAHYSADVVSVVDTATYSVTATTTGVSEPYAVVVADRAYVSAASTSDDAVVAVDIRTGAPLAAKLIDNAAGGMAINPTGDVLYVARTGDDSAHIVVIDIESGNAGTVDVSTAPGAAVGAVRVSTDGSRLFAVVTADGGSALAVIDTKRRALVHKIPLIESVADIAVHPGGHLVYASGWDAQRGGVIVVIDAVGARVVDTVEVSGLPTQLVVSGQVLYCIDREDVVVMSTVTNRLIDCIDMGRELSCLAVSGDGKKLFVAGYDGAISVLRVGLDATSVDVFPDMLQLN